MYLTPYLGYCNVELSAQAQHQLYHHLFTEVSAVGLYLPVPTDSNTTAETFELDGIIYGMNKYQEIAHTHSINVSESGLLDNVIVRYYRWDKNNNNQFFNYSTNYLHFDKTTSSNELITSSALPAYLYQTWKKSHYFSKAVYHPVDAECWLAINLTGTYLITRDGVTLFASEAPVYRLNQHEVVIA